ncbi:hypothetical protein [Paludisphaera soli]|uniref:hypothetical protein n=1 Tax=Paludisphaera soli TaxID=2712865 RepID=UPI0013EAA6C0|nr:hypothetical protein [Paludisphaera soli]
MIDDHPLPVAHRLPELRIGYEQTHLVGVPEFVPTDGEQGEEKCDLAATAT